jgi:hypothetical protein
MSLEIGNHKSSTSYYEFHSYKKAAIIKAKNILTGRIKGNEEQAQELMYPNHVVVYANTKEQAMQILCKRYAKVRYNHIFKCVSKLRSFK